NKPYREFAPLLLPAAYADRLARSIPRTPRLDQLHRSPPPRRASIGCWRLFMAKPSFKMNNELEKRQSESNRIRDKYPDRIPVIVEKSGKTDIPDIDKKKYLVPADLTVGQFIYVVRKRIMLSPEKAIFVFVNNTLPPTASLMSALYEENKDADGFLYMTYSGESTFGSA
ncbi:unnamed protein product, partial [Urochloa humidicola]